MANIRVDSPIAIYNGQPITFRSPVDISQVSGLIVYYPDGNSTVSQVFQFADAHGNNVGDLNLFAADVVVKVILDTEKHMAFVQNADTNAYLEGELAKKYSADKTIAETTDCNIDLKAGGNRMLVSRYTTTTLNSPMSEKLVTDGVGMVITYAYTANYGRQICLTGSGGGLCMRNMSGGTISKWVKLADTDYAVPLDGSKAMTGNLTIQKSSWPILKVKDTTQNRFAEILLDANGNACFHSKADDSNYLGLIVKPETANIATALLLGGKINNAWFQQTILHTGNKPSGSYTGNGSATARTISTGNMGGSFVIYSTNGVVLVTPNGAIIGQADGTVRFSFEVCGTYPIDGSFKVASTSDALNKNGAVYTYISL